MRKLINEGRDRFDKSFQYNWITDTSEKYLELYYVFGCDQDEFSANMFKKKKGIGKVFSLKHFILGQKFQK